MRIIYSKNILKDQNFTFDQSELTLSVSDREIITDNCVGISFLFQDNSEYEFKNFIRFFLNNHVGENSIQSLNYFFQVDL